MRDLRYFYQETVDHSTKLLKLAPEMVDIIDMLVSLDNPNFSEEQRAWHLSEVVSRAEAVYTALREEARL